MVADYGRSNEAADLTFADLARAWLDERRRYCVVRSTIRESERALERNILPHLGEVPLVSISPQVLRDFQAAIMRQVTERHAYRLLLFTRAILLEAADRELIDHDLVARLKPKLPERTLFNRAVPGAGEVQQFIATAQRMTDAGSRHIPPAFDIQLILLVETGARAMECSSLTWADVDCESNEVTVSTSGLRKASRKIPITASLSHRLADLFEAVTPTCRKDAVFRTHSGLPISSAQSCRAFRDVQRNGAGVGVRAEGSSLADTDVYSLGDLRSLTRQLWLRAGAPAREMRYLSGLSPDRNDFSLGFRLHEVHGELGGHIRTTMERYVHGVDGS